MGIFIFQLRLTNSKWNLVIKWARFLLFPHRVMQRLSWNISKIYIEAHLEEGVGGACPLFLQSLVFLWSLWRTILCLLKLKGSLIMHLWHTFTKYYQTSRSNHLLFGRLLLCYSNTTSALIRNLTDKILIR